MIAKPGQRRQDRAGDDERQQRKTVEGREHADNKSPPVLSFQSLGPQGNQGSVIQNIAQASPVAARNNGQDQ